MDKIDIAVLNAITNKESLETILSDSEELVYCIAHLIDTGYLSIQVTPRGMIAMSRPQSVVPECTDASCTACSSCR